MPLFPQNWRWLGFVGLAAILVLRSHAAAPADASITPVALSCEYRVDPQGIEETRPRLGWKLAAVDPEARGLRQTAYQIQVASSPGALAAGQGDIWDSGRVTSTQTNNVVFSGRALQSRDRCQWRVRVWDEHGQVSKWSNAATWSMGLLAATDWKAEWIGLDAERPTDGSALSIEQESRLRQGTWMRAGVREVTIRREFEIPGDRSPVRATLLVVPDGTCAVTVNGRALATVARWDRCVPLDLTPALHAGGNVVELHLVQGDDNPAAVLGELEISWSSGEPLRLPVDESWRVTAPAAAAPLAAIPEKKTPWGSPENATRFLPPAPFLRRGFVVAQPVRRATLYATALGLYELQLNGRRVGEDVLAPGWTDYRHRVQYQTYDVTAQVRRGDNALGAILGAGWFAGTLAHVGDHHYGEFPRLLAQLEIEFADGSRQIVVTDGQWRAASGPLRYADVYQGSAYDARRAWPGWAEPGFDDSAWSAPATGLRTMTPAVEASTMDPPRVIEALPARAVTRLGPHTWLYDFGQNMVGWVRLAVHGEPGRRLVVRHGEMLNPDGTLYTSNLRGAAATDVYWLRGDGEETLAPRFTFHGFRYAEISGLDEPLPLGAVTGEVVHNPLARTGWFACADPRVNQLFHNIVWGQKGNYLAVPTDCPQRDERLGWTGDTQFFVRTADFNFDVAAFLETWLTTLITDGQRPDGTFPSFAPALDDTAWPSTGWGDAAILCTHALWLVHGDTRIVERHFDALTRYLDFVESRTTGGITRIGGFGDWLDKGGAAPGPLMDTAYYAHLCRLMGEMAAAIGRDEAARRFAARADAGRAAFQREFVLPDGRLKDSGETGYALAFTMNLVPAAQREQMAGRFADAVAARDWHIATGFIGTPRLLPALHEAGRDDVAHRLLLQDTYPSWLYQVKLGATTMWERWDGWTPEKGFQSREMNSFNHYAFGAVGEYLYRQVAGIDTEGPGFQRILIRPTPGLASAGATYEAVTGRIVSQWQTLAEKFMLDVVIPPNTTATICVPADRPEDVREGGRPAVAAPGLELLEVSAGEARYRAVSGHYRFESERRVR